MKTKRGQKWLCGVGTLTICFMLTGCGHEHTWVEATCTVPKTCSECGETEGEALGHTWVEATCAEPKTCSVCGETEGETIAHTWIDATCAEAKHCSVCGEIEGKPLEHILTEANYQQAATCEVCGKTVGEPLEAYFEKYGLTCDAELDTTYTVAVPCKNNHEYTTEEKISFSEYDVFEFDDEHEEKEGYEWRAVTITYIYDDENANKYGYEGYNWHILDYYDEAWNDTDTDVINYNGIDYPEWEFDREVMQNGWDNNIHTAQERLYFHTAKEYDGFVIVLLPLDGKWSNSPEGTPTYARIDEGAIAFRLK